MHKKYSFISVSLIALGMVLIFGNNVHAAPTIPIPNVNISIGNSNTPAQYVDNIKLLILLTILTLLPSIIMMMTSFLRIIVVLSFLKNALGTQQTPPTQVLTGLAIFLTIFIMAPTYNAINTNALIPYTNNKISQDQAIEAGSKPLRDFMLKRTTEKDLKLFVDASKIDTTTITKENIPLYVVTPAYIISELKTAFTMGFLLYIPFLVIDLVVASILMSMGMMMLPPVMISLPFKILLFVMVDGWYLIVQSLLVSFK